MDDVAIDKIGDFESALIAYMDQTQGELVNRINETGDYGDEIADAFKKAVEDFKTNNVW